MPHRNLYALIVGISKYHHVRDLSGAYSDALALDEYLNKSFVQSRFGSIKKELLLNNEARKDSILRAWNKLFGRAEKGDVCLFYFAGHGVREVTQIPAFQEGEIDGKLESLVCVDSKPSWGPLEDRSQSTTLADKELRYLIHGLSEAGMQVVTIFDCCSSGDNTRSLSTEVPDFVRQINRDEIPERAYEGFIFHKEIPKEYFSRQTLQSLLPLGNHVQLSACRDVEVAYELPKDSRERRGVFTKALLETLEVHQGKISFHDLYHQVSHAMPQNQEFYQRPQFFFQSLDWENRYLEFLSFAPLGGQQDIGISQNSDTQEWRLDLGGLHGIHTDTQVKVYSVRDKETLLDATITSIHAGYSVIAFDPKQDHPVQSYVARVQGLSLRPLNIGFNNLVEEESKKIHSILTYQQDKEETAYFIYTQEASGIDYQIRLEDGLLSVCRPNDTRPIVHPISYELPGNQVSRDKLKLVKSDMKQVAQWTFLREMEIQHTANSQLKGEFPLELRIFQRLKDGEEIEIPPKKGGFSVHLTEKLDTEKPFTYLRLELANRSEVSLFCALLYLSMDFEITSKILSPQQAWLDPGQVIRSQEIPIRNGKDKFIPFSFAHPYIVRDSWPAKEDYFKLICSETQFDISIFDRPSLPMPYSLGPSRNFGSQTAEPKALEPSWLVKTLEMQVFNPHVVALPRTLDRSNSFGIHVEGMSADSLKSLVEKDMPEYLPLRLDISEPYIPTRSISPQMLSVVIGLGGAVLAPIVDWFIKKVIDKKEENKPDKVILKTSNGMELSFPADATSAEIQKYVQVLEKMGPLAGVEIL